MSITTLALKVVQNKPNCHFNLLLKYRKHVKLLAANVCTSCRQLYLTIIYVKKQKYV